MVCSNINSSLYYEINQNLAEERECSKQKTVFFTKQSFQIGKQIVQCLIQYCKRKFGAEEFIYSARDENEAANRLAKSLGFRMIDSDLKVDCRDGIIIIW